MPKLPGGARHGATDFFQLSVAYAKQEAIGPITRQARTLGKGIAGAFLLALGTPLLAIGLLRALQAELGSTGSSPVPALARRIATYPSSVYVVTTNAYGSGHHLSGNLSWVPYVAGCLFCFLVAGWCVTQVTRREKV